MASLDEWLDAYEVVYRALPAESDDQCPELRSPNPPDGVHRAPRRRLRLRFLLV
ncbi:hypothetical protein ACFXA2_12440 [Micromonospora chalcea]